MYCTKINNLWLAWLSCALRTHTIHSATTHKRTQDKAHTQLQPAHLCTRMQHITHSIHITRTTHTHTHTHNSHVLLHYAAKMRLETEPMLRTCVYVCMCAALGWCDMCVFVFERVCCGVCFVMRVMCASVPSAVMRVWVRACCCVKIFYFPNKAKPQPKFKMKTIKHK